MKNKENTVSLPFFELCERSLSPCQFQTTQALVEFKVKQEEAGASAVDKNAAQRFMALPVSQAPDESFIGATARDPRGLFFFASPTDQYVQIILTVVVLLLTLLVGRAALRKHKGSNKRSGSFDECYSIASPGNDSAPLQTLSITSIETRRRLFNAGKKMSFSDAASVGSVASMSTIPVDEVDEPNGDLARETTTTTTTTTIVPSSMKLKRRFSNASFGSAASMSTAQTNCDVEVDERGVIVHGVPHRAMQFKRRSSNASIGSVSSMSTTLTNCDVEVDDHGVIISSAPSSPQTRRSTRRLSTQSGALSRHGNKTNSDLATSFHQRVETLLESLIASDSEDDDTDDDSYSHHEIGYHDLVDFDSSAAGAADEKDHEHFLQAGHPDSPDKATKHDNPQASSRSGIVLSNLFSIASKRRRRRRSGSNKLVIQAMQEEEGPSAVVTRKSSTSDRTAKNLREVEESCDIVQQKRSGSCLTRKSQGLVLATHKISRQDAKPRKSFPKEMSASALIKSSSDKRMMTRNQSDLVVSSSDEGKSFQTARRRFLEAAAAALDVEEAFGDEPQGATNLLLPGSSSGRNSSFEESDDDDEAPAGTQYGVARYYRSSLAKKNGRGPGITSRRSLLLENIVSDIEDVNSESLCEEQQSPAPWFSTSMLTLKTDTDTNGLSSSLLDNDDFEVHDEPVIVNIDLVDRQCTSDSHRRKLKKARLVVRVVLGSHRKDYKTSKACFEAIDVVASFHKEIRQAVLEMSKCQHVWNDLKTLWEQLWRAEDAFSMIFPALPSDPRDVDSYDYVLLLVCKIFSLLYPTLNPNMEPNAYADPFEDLENSGDGPKEGKTLFLGTVRGVPLSMSLSSFDGDRTKRTRLTPYKEDQHYPLSLQDALRVVRSILGPSHKRVSGQDCLHAIQTYGLLKIHFHRLSEQLELQRSRMVDLGTALHQICELLPNVISDSKQSGGNNNSLCDLMSHIHKRQPPTENMDPNQASIFKLAEHIRQLLCDEES